MHTHNGEESHVLLKEQKIPYALGDKIFVKEGPYIVNIPPGVPIRSQIWMMKSRNLS